MGNTKVHPTAITTVQNSNFELGVEIAKLRYDQICELFSGFIFESRKQLEGDKNLGKVRLAERCEDALAQAKILAETYAELTIFSEPYMTEEFAKIPMSTAILNTIKKQ